MYKHEEIKNKLIAAGVKNLKEFGYPHVNEENILTDLLYANFFISMLNENKGKAGKEVDDCIDELLTEINGD